MNNKLLGVSALTNGANPIKQSQYPYYQDLGKALDGLEKALQRHSGEINEVKNTDILAFSNIDPDVLENLFGDANGILKVIYKEIGTLFEEVDRLTESELSEEALIIAMLKKLQEKSPMLRIIFILDDCSIWKRSLRKITARLAQTWPRPNTKEWEYLYGNFCCQFQSVLEKWGESDFSDNTLKPCTNLLELWIVADGLLGDTAEGLLSNL